MRSNGSSLSRLAVAVLFISAMFLVGVLLSSTANIYSTRGNRSDHDSSSSSSEAALNMLDSSAAADGKIGVPAMQPFSTVDPADAHCPHMDRPEVSTERTHRLLFTAVILQLRCIPSSVCSCVSAALVIAAVIGYIVLLIHVCGQKTDGVQQH